MLEQKQGHGSIDIFVGLGYLVEGEDWWWGYALDRAPSLRFRSREEGHAWFAAWEADIVYFDGCKWHVAYEQLLAYLSKLPSSRYALGALTSMVEWTRETTLTETRLREHAAARKAAEKAARKAAREAQEREAQHAARVLLAVSRAEIEAHAERERVRRVRADARKRELDQQAQDRRLSAEDVRSILDATRSRTTAEKMTDRFCNVYGRRIGPLPSLTDQETTQLLACSGPTRDENSIEDRSLVEALYETGMYWKRPDLSDA